MKFLNFKKQKTNNQTPLQDLPAGPSTLSSGQMDRQGAKTIEAKGIKILEKGTSSLLDIIAPPSVEVDFNFIRVGDFYYRTFFVVGYPRFVSPNWLSPLIDFDHSMNVSMFCYPASSNDVLSDIRRKIAEMEATISSQTEEGKIVDPKVQAA